MTFDIKYIYIISIIRFYKIYKYNKSNPKMNKNLRLLLWIAIFSILAVFAFKSNLNVFAASAWYGYGCNGSYGYGYGCSTQWGWSTAWWTYNPSTSLYTVSWGNITQLTMTNYGLVQTTTSNSWTTIQLLDLSTYIDRSNPAINEFPNIQAIQDKWVSKTPHTWVENNWIK